MGVHALKLLVLELAAAVRACVLLAFGGLHDIGLDDGALALLLDDHAIGLGRRNLEGSDAMRLFGEEYSSTSVELVQC